MRLVLLVLLALATPAIAEPYTQRGDCGSNGQVAVHRIEITGGTPETTFYVDDESYLHGNGIWVYTESNGVWTPKLPGVYLQGLSNEDLQRGFQMTDRMGPWDPAEICYDEANGEPYAGRLDGWPYDFGIF